MNFVNSGEEQESSGAKARVLAVPNVGAKAPTPTSIRSGVRHDTSEI